MAQTPKKVKVGPFDVSVVKEDLSLTEAFGVYSTLRQQIILDENVDEQVLKEALLHEIFHVVCFVSGITETKKQEEELVRAITPHFLNFMRENPGVLDYIIGR